MSLTLPRGLYAITPEQVTDTARLLDMVRRCLAGGTRTIQYRSKGSDRTRLWSEAQAISALCRQYGATFIINDHLDLARDIGADGVHLGKDDQSCAEARQQAGADLVVGVSCYDSLPRARQAVADGASYVAFGSAFPSPTKPGVVRADLSLYRQAAAELHIPVVAIGGITPHNAADLISAGCHAVAVISALFDATDLTPTAAAFSALFGSDAAADRLE